MDLASRVGALAAGKHERRYIHMLGVVGGFQGSRLCVSPCCFFFNILLVSFFVDLIATRV